jgi:hypothetical protein
MVLNLENKEPAMAWQAAAHISLFNFFIHILEETDDETFI